MDIKYLWFQVTNLCNSRCDYCTIWQNKPYAEEMTPKQLCKILSDNVFRNLKYLLNSGGEPTLDPCLEEFLLVEHDLFPNAIIQLSTNGLLPDRVLSVAKLMYNKNHPLQVGISLDGMGQEHDAIRGVKGNFKKVEALIPKLRKYALVTVGATLTEENLPQNIKALNWAKKHNLPFIFHWLNRSSFYGNFTDKHKNQKIIDAVKMLPPSLYRDMWLKDLLGKPVKFSCKALKDFCVLKRNGDISPCLSHWNVSIGNALHNSPSFLFSIADREFVKDCNGCLNNWGVCWSLSTFQKYLWWGKRKIKELLS